MARKQLGNGNYILTKPATMNGNGLHNSKGARRGTCPAMDSRISHTVSHILLAVLAVGVGVCEGFAVPGCASSACRPRVIATARFHRALLPGARFRREHSSGLLAQAGLGQAQVEHGRPKVVVVGAGFAGLGGAFHIVVLQAQCASPAALSFDGEGGHFRSRTSPFL